MQRWLDGYQQFTGVQYHPSLVLLVDVRAVLPGSVSSSPQGWACLPVFEPAGCYVASGTYQLPLFQVGGKQMADNRCLVNRC
jgi:hypothetical protein